MKNINQISDVEIDEIINGCIEGAYPTSHEVAMALELKNLRSVAAHEQEPVGWTDEQELRDVETDGCGYLFKANPITPHADLRRVIKLYANPAPSIPAAVPEEATPEMQAAGAAAIRFDTTSINKLFTANAVWRAMRAAMLQAEPGGRDYRAIVERIAEIMHGSVTDIDLLVVTVLSMKQQQVSAHEKSSA